MTSTSSLYARHLRAFSYHAHFCIMTSRVLVFNTSHTGACFISMGQWAR